MREGAEEDLGDVHYEEREADFLHRRHRDVSIRYVSRWGKRKKRNVMERT